MPQLITGPATEPVSLDDMKAFLRITHADEDTVLAMLLTTARQMVESAAARILLNQTWRVVHDAWPPSGLLLAPLAPVREILAARLRDAAGVETALPLDLFTLRGERTPAVIAFDRARVPPPSRPLGGIELDLLIGHGETAADVPADLVHAVRLLAAWLYERRDEAGDGGLLPQGVAVLLAPYRPVRL